MKLNLAHVVTYLVAGLVWLASLDQTLVTSLVGPSLAKYATGIIVLAGAIVVFLQHVGVIAPPVSTTAGGVSVSPTVNKQAGFIRLGGALILASIACSVSLYMAGCSTVSSWLSSPTGIEVDVAVVDVAIATAEAKGVSAAEINKVAKAALAADAGTPATIGAVSTAVNGAIAKANLPAGDLAAINLIEVALSQAITAKIGANPSVTALQTDVASVLSLVISATGG